MWFGELCYWCCLPVLPCPAWVLLCKPFFSTLYGVRQKPRKAGFENLTGNIEFPWQVRTSYPTAPFFDETGTAASPASGKLLRSLFLWEITTNWNPLRLDFMQEILKTFFLWFFMTLYVRGSYIFSSLEYIRFTFLTYVIPPCQVSMFIKISSWETIVIYGPCNAISNFFVVKLIREGD